MATIPFIGSGEFSEKVEKSILPVLLDFNAEWCVPCKRMAPILEKLALEWSGKVCFFQVDADENPELVMRFGVMSIPTVILIKDGKETRRATGLQTREKLESLFYNELQENDGK